MKKMEWEDYVELLEWASKNGGPEDFHSEDYWRGFNECLGMMASLYYPEKFFEYLMEKWSKPIWEKQ